MVQDDNSVGQGFLNDQFKLFKEHENAARRLAEHAHHDALQLGREQQAELQNRLWRTIFQAEKVSDGSTSKNMTHDKTRKGMTDLESDDEDDHEEDDEEWSENEQENVEVKKASDDGDQEPINSLQMKFAIANDEVVEAQKMAVQVLECFPDDGSNQTSRSRNSKFVEPKQAALGIKMMGSIDEGSWTKAFKKKYKNTNWAVEMKKAFSKWEKLIRNPKFQPFNLVRIGEDKWKQTIDHKDPRLASLKAEFGEEVYNSVTTALLEIEQYKRVADILFVQPGISQNPERRV